MATAVRERTRPPATAEANGRASQPNRCTDADGVMDVSDKRVPDIRIAGFDTTSDRLGSRVEWDTAVPHEAADGVVRRIHPDLMALPRAGMPGMATGRERALRLDRGQPPPALALWTLRDACLLFMADPRVPSPRNLAE